MASPHAVGVAALIVAQYGRRDKRNGGLTMRPDRVERILERHGHRPRLPGAGAVHLRRTPAPAPEDYTATCEGSPKFNGFYGDGIVDALAAVRR